METKGQAEAPVVLTLAYQALTKHLSSLEVELLVLLRRVVYYSTIREESILPFIFSEVTLRAGSVSAAFGSADCFESKRRPVLAGELGSCIWHWVCSFEEIKILTAVTPLNGGGWDPQATGVQALPRARAYLLSYYGQLPALTLIIQMQ